MVNELPNLKPIGIIRNNIKEKPASNLDWWQETISEIIIDATLTEALEGIENYSHLIILYWMHRLTDKEMPLKVHPRRRQDLPSVGLFASRSPNRPNPIGKATVLLLERQGNIIKVKGLDALDGSPVLDIKPYIPGYDSVANAKVPPWTKNQ